MQTCPTGAGVRSNVELPGDDDIELCVLNDIDYNRDVVVPEAAAHDLDIWPHLHPTHLMDAMLPTAVPRLKLRRWTRGHERDREVAQAVGCPPDYGDARPALLISSERF